MKNLSKLNLYLIVLFVLLSACNTKTGTEEPMVTEAAPMDTQADEVAVKKVMGAYQAGIEALSLNGLSDLFLKDSEVFESGGVEGSFDHYAAHHLEPELKAFESFNFSDYEIKVTMNLPYAFTTETYNYTIVLASDGRKIEQKGVATSILKKLDGNWKILKTHTSARAKRKSTESDH